jgi:hypothetical protein
MAHPRSVDYGDGWLTVKWSFRVELPGYRNSDSRS